jgi:predicted ATPase
MIGRDHERDAAARFLDRVPDGPVGLVIEGEAGIGKTTVWLEALREARARGYRALKAGPAEGERDLSFAALADLLGDAMADVADALPQPQRDALDAALLRRSADESVDPRTTGTGVVSVLTTLAVERPVFVAIDDAQWLDRASERALEFAARRLPNRFGIVVARRSDGDSPAPLGLDRALPADAIEHLVLGPLSLAALHHLVERAGLRLSRPMLARVTEVSGGERLLRPRDRSRCRRRDNRGWPG